MGICILCEESKVFQVKEKMKNNNILKIDLSPTRVRLSKRIKKYFQS
jgi:hypothetical protein